MTTNNIEQDIWFWVDEVIIGLNLCPFAKKPRQKQQIAIHISTETTLESQLKEFEEQLIALSECDPSVTDTSLLVYPESHSDFDEYLDFLYLANMTIEQLGLIGDFQLASFHPNYQFEDTEPEDKENLTNTSPYPTIHIIREATVERVLKQYPNPELIPENNIKTVTQLSELKVAKLFKTKSTRSN
jgi:hypothetical protein